MNQAGMMETTAAPWRVDRFVIGVAMTGMGLLAALIWLETAPFLVALFGVGTLHLPWWLDQPGLPPVSLVDGLGVSGAIGLQFALLAAIGLWVTWVELRALGGVEWRELRLGGTDKGLLRTLVTGPWPFLWAIGVLALGNVLTLAIGGSPWGITFAFGLWGAKALQGMGVDMSQFEFWTWEYPALALADSVLVDTTSVMNFGLLLGAMLAAGLANRFNEASQIRPQGRQFLAAVVGGLLLGYGARLGFGCNIGALFSGIASASLHAWVWFASAFLGSLIGIRLRPWFRLPN